MIQGEIGAAAGGVAGGSEAGSAADSAVDSAVDSDLAAPSACGAAVDTSVASRSIVGGARLGRSWSGGDPVSSGLSSTITAVPSAVRCRNLAESGRIEHDPGAQAPVFG